MENPEKLDLTAEEVDRLGQALKDERFRDMLHEYVQEISDPENRRQYEEELKLLEQERGNNIEFIHPTPFKALKTSVDGKHKCFINICANDKVGKPQCKSGVSEDGRRGQHWSLPHSLHPGKQDKDPKGNKITIYDVVFHPDTLHIASRDKRFMDMVDSTAVNGIQDNFKVTLDKNNMRQMNTKYKGTPQPCVIRKPIPGYKAEEASGNSDPLTFSVQDEFRHNTTYNCDSKPKSFQIQPEKTSGPTKPKYTVKYRSVIDMQDFRCSRDSAMSPRPKEIVVTIDVPLLKSVKDTSLEVKEKNLLLDSKKPAYRLELPLAYPVAEDKGQAKFNKQKGQLTVTLPVLPSNEAWEFTMTGSLDTQRSVGDDDGVGEQSSAEEERMKGDRDGEEEELKQQTKFGKDEAGDKEEQMTNETEEEEQSVEGEEETEGQIKNGHEGKVKEQNIEGEEEREEHTTKGPEDEKQTAESEEKKQHMTKSQGGEDVGQSEEENFRKQRSEGKESEEVEINVEEEAATWKKQNREGQKSEERERGGDIPKLAHHSCATHEETALNLKTSFIRGETENMQENIQGDVRVKADVAFLKHTSSEEYHTDATYSTPATMTTLHRSVTDDCSISPWAEIPATEEANGEGEGVSGPGEQEESVETDEDDLQTEQTFHTEEYANKAEPALLREKDRDGNEVVISDHSTSAGFSFQNTLIYMLD